MKITPEKNNVKEWLALLEDGSKSGLHKNLWKKVYSNVAVPSRSRASVNLYKLRKYVKESEYVIVPGKVLGDIKVNKKFTITALEYSTQAKKSLQGAGCTILSINELYNLIKDKKARVNIIV